MEQRIGATILEERKLFLKRKCPVCGAEHGEMLKRIQVNISAEMREKITYPYFYDLSCCEECGMLFADTDLSKDDVDTYYKACNMYDNTSNVKKSIYDEGCELYFNSIAPYLTYESRIIDVGCGNGKFLGFLKEKGYGNVFGLDPAENSIQRLRENQIEGIVGSIYDQVPSGLQGKFDVVICSFVFEHLLLPEICLNNLISLMKSDGILYIAVPNAEGFETYLREVPNYFNQEHINYFTSKTLDYFCERNNLSRCSPDEECYHVMCPSSPEVVISAVYRQNGGAAATQKKRDECGKKSVEAYFTKIEQQQQRQINSVRELLNHQEQLIIWGTGGFASSLLCDIAELSESVICFVDNNENKQNSTFWGKEVISPEKLCDYPLATIMICIMMNSESVVRQIEQLNLKNKIFVFH